MHAASSYIAGLLFMCHFYHLFAYIRTNFFECQEFFPCAPPLFRRQSGPFLQPALEQLFSGRSELRILIGCNQQILLQLGRQGIPLCCQGLQGLLLLRSKASPGFVRLCCRGIYLQQQSDANCKY